MSILNILGIICLIWICKYVLKIIMGIVNALIFNILIGIRPKRGHYLKGWIWGMPRRAIKLWSEYPNLDITTTSNGWKYNSNWWFLRREK